MRLQLSISILFIFTDHPTMNRKRSLYRFHNFLLNICATIIRFLLNVTLLVRSYTALLSEIRIKRKLTVLLRTFAGQSVSLPSDWHYRGTEINYSVRFRLSVS